MATPIDLTENYAHLSKAPIVEAALDIRVVSSVKWDENILQNELKHRLPDFPKVEPVSEARFQFVPQGKPGSSKVENLGCVGFRLDSNDKLHVVQFNKGSFVFSRLKPYENWEQFSREAFRLLAIYNDLLGPKQVGRIGLRFINRVAIKQDTPEYANYFQYPPESLKGLNWPLTGFLHHDVMKVPETSYSVNLIKTIQNVGGVSSLVLDIDVFMQEHFGYNETNIKKCVEEMRLVKNKIFFNFLTKQLIEGMQ